MAFLNASILFVGSPFPIESVILPEASSTSTTSSARVVVLLLARPDDMADKATRKSEPSDLVTDSFWSANGPFTKLIVSVATVLSAQIRPTVEVLKPWVSYQMPEVFGSLMAASCAGCAAASSAAALIGKADTNSVNTSASIKRTACSLAGLLCIISVQSFHILYCL